MSPSASPAPLLSPDIQSSSSSQWVFEEKAYDVKPGFQLVQVVFCSSLSSNGSNGRESATSDRNDSRKPVTISSLQYSIDMGL
jgi:hypothetical protein